MFWVTATSVSIRKSVRNYPDCTNGSLISTPAGLCQTATTTGTIIGRRR
jgi:hypothetical protein